MYNFALISSRQNDLWNHFGTFILKRDFSDANQQAEYFRYKRRNVVKMKYLYKTCLV
jgi:hypothetical protein